MESVTIEQALARRLERHGLGYSAIEQRGRDVVGAVAAVCGIHAQVMSAAELSIGIRVAAATRSSVRAALSQERSLVKTYGPRGTVHLLPARDLPMWTAALSSLPQQNSAAPTVRLSPGQTDEVVAAIGDALRDGPLTAEELDHEVARRTGEWASELVMPAFNGYWPRWRQALHIAAHRGALCFGPPRGRQTTYASPQEWLGERMSQRDGLDAIVRAYLRAYGPATPQQFAQWIGAPRSWVAGPFESMTEVSLDGAPAWIVPGDDSFSTAPPAGVRLLPYFDAYAVGSHPRSVVFPGRASERALSKGQAGVYPVLLHNGTVSGVWHSRRSGRKLHLTVETIGRVPTRAIREQAEVVADVLEADAELTLGKVTVGPHA